MPAHHESDDHVNSRRGAHLTEPAEAADDIVVERPDDDDYDLLTFGEAGARLAEEIIKQQRDVDGLRESGAEPDQIADAERRLGVLQQAQERNRKPSLDELRQSGFFGRRG